VRLGSRRVGFHRYLKGSKRRSRTATNFCYATQHAGMEVSSATTIADADWDIFKDDKPAFMANRLALDKSSVNFARAVLASKIVHGFSYLISYTVRISNSSRETNRDTTATRVHSSVARPITT
jgi:hypothetical protein